MARGGQLARIGGEAMELNFSGKSVVWESHVCESPLIGGAVIRGVEESRVEQECWGVVGWKLGSWR